MKGNEKFLLNNENLDFDFSDFWRFQYSNIYSLHGEIAEFVVARALGVTEAQNSAYWTLWDITYRDVKIEVKATAYDQQGRVVRTGVGCCNTAESAFGVSGGFNSANSALKKAKKRAVVDLALTLGSLSNCFSQDLEDDNNEQRASEILKDDDPITAKQAKRLFAIAATKEITAEKAKQLLASWGFTSTRDIKQKDYDSICEKFEKYGE